MTSQKFTTKTASLRTVLLDTKKINSKKVETDELILNGENIEEKIPKFVPKEHVHRCEITEDENYIIYDDMGNLVDCKLDKLITQNYLFLSRHDITEFSYDLSNLSYGTGMFEGCANLTTFKSSLPSLTAAGGMFMNCNLSEESVENILNSLTEKDNNANISMTINSLALPKLCEITNTSYQDFHRVYQGTKSIPFKNYTLSVDLKDLPAGYKTVEYLESTGTQYIDTGVNLSNESEVKCEYMAMESTPKYADQLSDIGSALGNSQYAQDAEALRGQAAQKFQGQKFQGQEYTNTQNAENAARAKHLQGQIAKLVQQYQSFGGDITELAGIIGLQDPNSAIENEEF